MRITVSSKALKDAIAWGAKGLNKSLGESASGAQTLLVIDGGELHIKSFDGQKAFRATIPTSGGSSTEIVEVKLFGESLVGIMSILKDEPMTLDIQDTEVKFILPRSEFAIARNNSRAPKLPDTPHAIGTVDATDFKRMVVKVAGVALAEASAQQVLSSVLLEFTPSEKRLRLEATNRISMFIYDLPYLPDSAHADGTPEGESVKILVPSSQIKTLVSGLPEGNDVTIRADEMFVGVESAGFEGYVGMINVDPVGYKSLMDAVNPLSFKVDRKELITAVRNVSNVSTNGEKVILRIAPDTAMIVTDMSGKSRVEVDAANMMGVPEDALYDVKFTPAVILGALNAATTNEVSINFAAEIKPFVFREVKVDGTIDPSFFYMSMPLR